MTFGKIQFLTDENIFPKVVAFLRQRGYDVLDTKEQRWFGAEDETLLDRAYHGQRIIVTHDADFGTLAINQGKPYYGIIYIRLRNMHPVNVIRTLDRIFTIEVEFLPGTIWVVEESRVRIRHPESD